MSDVVISYAQFLEYQERRRWIAVELKLPVRRSSRRIMTMRFRPANLRVINRCDSRLDRPELCVSE